MNYGLRRFLLAGFILWVRGDKRAIQQLFSLLSCVFLGPCCFIDSGFCDFLVDELSFAGPPRCPTWYGRCYKPRGGGESSSSLAAGNPVRSHPKSSSNSIGYRFRDHKGTETQRYWCPRRSDYIASKSGSTPLRSSSWSWRKEKKEPARGQLSTHSLIYTVRQMIYPAVKGCVRMVSLSFLCSRRESQFPGTAQSQKPNAPQSLLPLLLLLLLQEVWIDKINQDCFYREAICRSVHNSARCAWNACPYVRLVSVSSSVVLILSTRWSDRNEMVCRPVVKVVHEHNVRPPMEDWKIRAIDWLFVWVWCWIWLQPGLRTDPNQSKLMEWWAGSDQPRQTTTGRPLDRTCNVAGQVSAVSSPADKSGLHVHLRPPARVPKPSYY